MSHEHKDERIKCLHVGLSIAKVVLKVVSIAAAFCAVKEIHKVHRAIEAHHKK